MNVLQLISPTGFYGAERWILALATHLPDSKTRCDLALTSEIPDKKFELIERYPPKSGQVNRIELKHRFDLRVIPKLAKIIRDDKIDIVHSHGYKSDILALLATAKSGITTVTTPHGYTKARKPKDLIYEALGKFALRKFDCVVPLSEELKRDVLTAGVKPDKIRLILNAVDLQEIDKSFKKEDSGIKQTTQQGRKLGYVGQLVPRKRVHLLIELFDKLWRQDNSTTLEIAGDGPTRESLEQIVAKLPGANSVRFHGFVDDRLTLLRSLDLFVMTSEAEGIPRVMMEAMSLGTPCAAYAIDGITDLISHGETGMLADEGDVTTLMRNCEQVLNEPALAKRLSVAARQQIEKKHSAQSMAKAYKALYEELI